MPDDDLTTQTQTDLESARPAPRRRRAAGRAAGAPSEPPAAPEPATPSAGATSGPAGPDPSEGAASAAVPIGTGGPADPPPAAAAGVPVESADVSEAAAAPTKRRARSAGTTTTRTRSTRASRAKAASEAAEATETATVEVTTAPAAITEAPGSVAPQAEVRDAEPAGSTAQAPAVAQAESEPSATEASAAQAPAPVRRTRSRRAVRESAPASGTPATDTPATDTPATEAAASTDAVASPATPEPVAAAPAESTATDAPSTPAAEAPKTTRRTRARRATSAPVSPPAVAETTPPASDDAAAGSVAAASTADAAASAEPVAADGATTEPAAAPRTRTRARGTRRRATSENTDPTEGATAGTAPAAAVAEPVVAEAVPSAVESVVVTGSVGAPEADAIPASAAAADVADEADVAELADEAELADGAVVAGAESATTGATAVGTDQDEAPDPAATVPAQDDSSAPSAKAAGTRGRSRSRRVAAPTWTDAEAERTPAARPAARRPVAMVTFQAPELSVEPRWRRDVPPVVPPVVPVAPIPVDEVVAPAAAPEAENTARTQVDTRAPVLDEDDEETTLGDVATGEFAESDVDDGDFDDDDEQGTGSGSTRRRRRGRRGRGRARGDEDGPDEFGGTGSADDAPAVTDAGPDGHTSVEADWDGETAETTDDTEDTADRDGDDAEGDDERASGSRRRRRRRRRSGGDEATTPDDPPNTVVHVREIHRDDDQVRGLSGSTRLEAKRQRRREGRDNGRRRPPIVTEAEFLARREAVERRMIVRHAGDRTQIAVLEDGVLVEHFVTRASSASYAGNVYLGRVQNVLASMEAAFVDIGKGRNAVLYAGEVNYDASGLDGRPRKIEQVLKSGQPVLVQVSKDPLGHKGARLTSQISLPGRYLVYVPDGQNAGISRKLPDTERSRLKSILKKITPENGGVIVRTAAEGASEAELARDVERLAAQWEDIQRRSKKASAPSLLYGEPDLVVRVIRDIFNEDFTELVVQGSGEARIIEEYIDTVAPDLRPRIRRYTGTGDVFADYRVDEQLAKALDRKVWLPSGGSLVIDRTEAMTVVDVNTGKFTGKGGNLEETVTKNNLEAAEEIVRQLRLRDIGGIIVIDFIDMVLESNRELVLRRLTECLGRDRTRHQVAEVTSLGLVQMTRKRVGQGLLEAYSEQCVHCNGRGVTIHLNGGGGDQSIQSYNGHGHAPNGHTPNGHGSSGAGHNGQPRDEQAPVDQEQPSAGVSTASGGQPEAATAGAASGGGGRRSRGAATRAAGGPALAAAISEAVASTVVVAGDDAAQAEPVPPVASDAGPTGGDPVAVNGNGHQTTASVTPLGADAPPPVYANTDDPDSLAGAEEGPAVDKPARRRRRASRPASTPSTEAASTSAEPSSVAATATAPEPVDHVSG
ncbi:Rne/Rng family ribonuclease [Frankia sp. AgPm24]|uniref:Rne/Rng family ribonuclease n=1 Tax=Frankia sp. AgPm24 TaxID=631128 RepID=UPI00200E1E06|nr:Rne/Rng family ribonuclease [Frankia sp. AgPm24]MCK9920405.1 Rne/Rng family ribonuclease [Frankia sp. AgPm24]